MGGYRRGLTGRDLVAEHTRNRHEYAPRCRFSRRSYLLAGGQMQPSALSRQGDSKVRLFGPGVEALAGRRPQQPAKASTPESVAPRSAGLWNSPTVTSSWLVLKHAVGY